MKTRVAIDAAGLHSGGGIQVATSFIDEIVRLDLSAFELTVFASSDVHDNLRKVGADTTAIADYRVYDVYGIKALWSGYGRELSAYDVVFTVFGPTYYRVAPAFHIVGFAQFWIASPNNAVYSLLPRGQRWKRRGEFFVKELFFRLADRYVVELEHVREQLVSTGFCRADRIDVVHNSIAGIYFSPEKWAPLPGPIKSSADELAIGFLGRYHFHKNIDRLPEVKEILHRRHGLEVEFVVTLNDAEWESRSESFRSTMRNVGPLSMAQCPTFYQQLDGVIFPSLLECFSACPIETMAMERPLFASDRGFVRDVCGDFAYYFDPMDSADIARVIAAYFAGPGGRSIDLATARRHAQTFSNARERAVKYLQIIERAAASKKR